MLVELDLFSGRPNPRWKLDEPSSRELLRLEANLAPTTLPPAELPGLGYRGFLYSGQMGRARAYGRFVRTARTVLADPTSSVERFLLDRLPPDLSQLRSLIAR